MSPLFRFSHQNSLRISDLRRPAHRREYYGPMLGGEALQRLKSLLLWSASLFTSGVCIGSDCVRRKNRSQDFNGFTCIEPHPDRKVWFLECLSLCTCVCAELHSWYVSSAAHTIHRTLSSWS
jgi:hypothetical protein